MKDKMTRRIKSKWLSHKNTRIYCVDFSGLGSDRPGLLAELEASSAALSPQPVNSMLVTVDVSQTDMMPEMVTFFCSHCDREKNPIRKMAIIGISGFQRIWYPILRKVSWPENARFFDGYDGAKDWVVSEGF
jgi:hypothetical protein